jgi:hypothetical protein
LTGRTQSFDDPQYGDIFVVRFNSAGVVDFQQTYQGVSAYTICVDSSNNVYVGTSSNRILKLGPSGSLIWANYYREQYGDYFYGIAADSSGNVYATGDTTEYDAGAAQDVFALKCDSGGNLIWALAFDGDDFFNDGGFGVVPADVGGVYITGGTPDVYLTWREVTADTNKEPYAVTPLPVSGTVETPTATLATPSGTFHAHEGVLDAGGGAEDMLVIKWKP